MSGLHAEAVFAAGYALFLLAIAVGIDLLARHSHRRSERYRTAGFTYHQHLDAWECPEGQHLRLHHVDHGQRVARYRARPIVCNACPRKEDCTDSDEGREIARALDPWPHSEAGRFHRGIGLVLVVLATLVCTVELVRHHAPGDILVAGSVLVLVGLAGARLAASFRLSPSGFPWDEPSASSR